MKNTIEQGIFTAYFELQISTGISRYYIAIKKPTKVIWAATVYDDSIDFAQMEGITHEDFADFTTLIAKCRTELINDKN